MRAKLGQYQQRMGGTVKGAQAFSVTKSGSGSTQARRQAARMRNGVFDGKGVGLAAQYQTFSQGHTTLNDLSKSGGQRVSNHMLSQRRVENLKHNPQGKVFSQEKMLSHIHK